jgi:hypothetical protein
VQLRWLHGRDDPRDSYWSVRYANLDGVAKPGKRRVLDRSAVLVAGLCYPSKDKKDGLFRLYGGQGLRIVAHLGAAKSGRAPVRITGAWSTLPEWPARGLPLQSLLRKVGVARLAKRIAGELPRAFGLGRGHTVVELGLPLPPTRAGRSLPQVLLAKTAPDPKMRGREDSYALVARFAFPGFALEPLRKRPLVASQADAMLYTQDPVSRNGVARLAALRPNRAGRFLDPERIRVDLGHLPAGTAPGFVQLRDSSADPDLQVLNCTLVDDPLPATAPMEVPATTSDSVRSNRFAAVNAFHHTSDLFARMRRYGLLPTEYFAQVERPLDVRYRAAIRPGAGDGRVVNAQVRWILRPGLPTKGIVELCFALGDLQSATGRLPSNLPSAAERSPLGVAADPRWCWHEFGHVLSAAACGALELDFAHSVGDALAAIVSDPDSRLAWKADGTAANAGAWRGVTFPWIQVPRRHDRDVQRGWGWTGIMNSRDRYFAEEGGLLARGYWTEQILSSALFRLYRAIGGDCEPPTLGGTLPGAVDARRDASDYTVYLIMRALKLLGAAAVTPATGPMSLVNALIMADEATEGALNAGSIVGGSARKVVRWAFEQQGLLGVPVPNSRVCGPETDAAVDLHIEDQRAKPDGPYSPASLLGDRWLAASGVIQVRPAGAGRKRIKVRVDNRGRRKASGVTVEVRVAPLDAAGGIPPYPDSAWQSLGTLAMEVPAATGAAPGEARSGGFPWAPAPGDYAILASATCEADRSNLDPALDLPCARVPGPTRTLVACDNNLGLRVITVN